MIKRKVKREIIEWIVIVSVFLTIYFSGWHVEILGGLQNLILKTGLMQPAVTPNEHRIPASYQLVMKSPNNELVYLEEFRGKVIFLNFWASWCSPCIAEMPEIHSLYQKMDKKNYVFLLVTTEKNAQKAFDLVRRKGYKFPVFQIASVIPKTYQSDVIPTTFVIDPQGMIAVRNTGMASYDNDIFIEFLRHLYLTPAPSIPNGM